MNARAFAIDAFPEGRWRIDYFGGTRKQPEVGSELEIEVFLSPVVRADYNPLSAAAVDSSRRRSVFVATGLLPRLAIGTVWEDKVEAVSSSPYHEKVFEIDTSLAFRFDLDAVMPDPFDEGEEPISHPALCQFAPQDQAGRAGYQFRLTAPIDSPDQYQLIIPCAEIMRFYFCTHDVLARTLFLGEWPTLIRKADTCDLDAEAFQIGLSQVRGLSLDTAFMLARYYKSRDMQFEVDSVFRQVQLAGANRGAMAYLSNFPFQGKTTLKVRCLGIPHERRIDGKKVVRWRHFVSQILSCSYPFPFKECYAKPHLDSQQGENAEDPSLPQFGIETRRLGSKRLPLDGDAMLSDAMEPDLRVQNIEQHLFESRFAYLAGKKVRRVTKDLQKYRGVRMPPPAPKIAEGFGTGEGRRRNSTTAPTTIAPHEGNMKAVVDLKQFVDAIKLLETGSRGYVVTSVVQEGVEPGVTIAGKVALPLRALAKGLGRGLRSRRRWLSTGETSTRHLMIVDVILKSKHVYLLELERGSEQNSERFSVLGCSAKDGAAIPGAYFIEFAQMIVRHRGWPPEKLLQSHPSLSHLRYSRSSHLKKDDAPGFAKRLESNLIEPVLRKFFSFLGPK